MAPPPPPPSPAISVPLPRSCSVSRRLPPSSAPRSPRGAGSRSHPPPGSSAGTAPATPRRPCSASTFPGRTPGFPRSSSRIQSAPTAPSPNSCAGATSVSPVSRAIRSGASLTATMAASYSPEANHAPYSIQRPPANLYGFRRIAPSQVPLFLNVCCKAIATMWHRSAWSLCSSVAMISCCELPSTTHILASGIATSG